MKKATLGVMLAAAWLVVLAGPASAGAPAFLINPHSGKPGTSIQASDPDGECDGNNAQVTVALVPASGPAVTSTTVVPNNDGTWATNLTVPDGTDPGSYTVTAHCDQDQGVDSFDYDPQDFTVTAATTTTTAPTTTTEPPSTTPTTTAPVTTPPPATPVSATPALTG